MKAGRWGGAGLVVGLLAAATIAADGQAGFDGRHDDKNQSRRRARNVIFFVGDGMGVSTASATRVFSVGLAGQLVIDQFRATRTDHGLPQWTPVEPRVDPFPVAYLPEAAVPLGSEIHSGEVR